MAPTLSPRETFRQAVADVAAKAKAILPQAVNGRVESAVKLVLAGDVFFCADGTVKVGSASDPAKTYTLAGHACDCQDFAYGQAPEGWCQHRIAAGIQKRVQEVLGQTVCDPDNVHTPASVPQCEGQPPPAPLPEARASVNVHLTIAGRQVQLTLRDHNEARLLVRLEEVLQRFPLPQPPSQGKDWCSIHNVAMQENHKEGRVWYSHKTADGWCKGRRR